MESGEMCDHTSCPCKVTHNTGQGVGFIMAIKRVARPRFVKGNCINDGEPV